MDNRKMIYLDDALDEIQRFYGYLDEDMVTRIHIGLKRLPSAQPNLQPTCNQLATDCISRRAAIDGADAIIARDTSGNNDVVKAMTAWKSYVEALPSAQRDGKWIKEHEEWFTDYPYKRTNCGKYSRARYHFCPNCGADMRGDGHENNR